MGADSIDMMFYFSDNRDHVKLPLWELKTKMVHCETQKGSRHSESTESEKSKKT